jgi:hypothetical protein
MASNVSRLSLREIASAENLYSGIVVAQASLTRLAIINLCGAQRNLYSRRLLYAMLEGLTNA